MSFQISTVSTPDLIKMLRKITDEIEVRMQAKPQVTAAPEPEPAPKVTAPAVPEIARPPEKDADFVLMIAGLIKKGGYAKAEERERVAEIAQEFGPWVERQGLPTGSGAGEWRRKTQFMSSKRAIEK